MRPCSPAPPTTPGLQELSWEAIEAKRMAGTRDERSNVNFMHFGVRLEMKLTIELATKLLEGPSVWRAVSEGTAKGDGFVEVHGDEVRDTNEGRVPPSAFNTTVHPIKGSVGTS